MTAAVAARPVTHADVEYLKTVFPARHVDAALNDGDLVLIDEQKQVCENGINH